LLKASKQPPKKIGDMSAGQPPAKIKSFIIIIIIRTAVNLLTKSKSVEVNVVKLAAAAKHH